MFNKDFNLYNYSLKHALHIKYLLYFSFIDINLCTKRLPNIISVHLKYVVQVDSQTEKKRFKWNNFML